MILIALFVFKKKRKARFQLLRKIGCFSSGTKRSDLKLFASDRAGTFTFRKFAFRACSTKQDFQPPHAHAHSDNASQQPTSTFRKCDASITNKTHTLRSRWGSRSSGRRGVRLPHPTPLLRDCWRTMGCRVWVGKNAQTQQPKRKKNVGETAAQQQKS